MRVTQFQQSVIDDVLKGVRRQKINEENTNHEKRIYLMVETALEDGNAPYAELLLRNYLGQIYLANMLTWINNNPYRRK